MTTDETTPELSAQVTGDVTDLAALSPLANLIRRRALHVLRTYGASFALPPTGVLRSDDATMVAGTIAVAVCMDGTLRGAMRETLADDVPQVTEAAGGPAAWRDLADEIETHRAAFSDDVPPAFAIDIERAAAALRAAAAEVEAQEAAIRRLADELETRDAEAERRAYFGPARAPLYGVTPDLHQPDPAAPTLRALWGKAPDLTGGLSAEAYVRRLRDAADSQCRHCGSDMALPESLSAGACIWCRLAGRSEPDPAAGRAAHSPTEGM